MRFTRSVRFIVTLLTLLLILNSGCTEKTIITNPPPELPDLRDPVVEWAFVGKPDGSRAPGNVVSGICSLAVLVSDQSAIDSVKLYLNGFARPVFVTDTTGIGRFGNLPYHFLWNTLSDSDGVYSLEARAWDSEGNMGVSPTLIVRISNTSPPPPPDRTPPTIDWVYPSRYSTLKGIDTLVISVFDSSAIDSLKIYINGTVSNLPPLTPPLQARGENAFLWNTANDSDGVYVLEARAWDASRNMGIAPARAVRVQNNEIEDPKEIDRNPPRIRIVRPETGVLVRDTLQLKFVVSDSSTIDSLKIFLSGEVVRILAGGNDSTYIVSIDSWRWTNGRKILEIRAWDSAGNVGISEPLGIDIDNHRVIWVPDDYQKIQDAINASVDGDTVRVRAGVYREGLRINKPIWLESESGPRFTFLEPTGFGMGVYVDSIVRDTLRSAIRGLTIRNSESHGIYLFDGGSLKVTNNIFVQAGARSAASIWIGNGISIASISNNVILDTPTMAIYAYICYSSIYNNIIANSDRYTIFNGYLYENPVGPDYNLIYNYGELTNQPPIRFGENNLIGVDPMFLDQHYRLHLDSPCVDSGVPELRDIDGSRSDMGAYGGPYAY